MVRLRDIAIELVGEEDADSFALWAFGKDYKALNKPKRFADAWNERHGDLHQIDLSSPILKDMVIITDLWRNRGGI
jgi:hypothetical protein